MELEETIEGLQTTGGRVLRVDKVPTPYPKVNFSHQDNHHVSSLTAAISLVVSAISMKEIAATMSGDAKNKLIASADTTISQFIDEYCGTPPSVIPIPWFGPPPRLYEVVTELAAVANTFLDGNMRTAILNVAGKVAQKAFGAG